MRAISQTNQFKNDCKREAKGRYRSTLVGELLAVIELLSLDRPLPDKYHDHSLLGEYTSHRECHLKPDLLLIYKKPDEVTLRLVRLGSHSALF